MQRVVKLTRIRLVILQSRTCNDEQKNIKWKW
jgi:hypothetical protein